MMWWPCCCGTPRAARRARAPPGVGDLVQHFALVKAAGVDAAAARRVVAPYVSALHGGANVDVAWDAAPAVAPTMRTLARSDRLWEWYCAAVEGQSPESLAGLLAETAAPPSPTSAASQSHWVRRLGEEVGTAAELDRCLRARIEADAVGDDFHAFWEGLLVEDRAMADARLALHAHIACGPLAPTDFADLVRAGPYVSGRCALALYRLCPDTCNRLLAVDPPYE